MIFNYIYKLAWIIILPFLILLAKFLVPKWKDSLSERLGQFNNLPQGDFARPIWFHAVSVGELQALLPLLKFFMGLRIIVSVTTVTAHSLAKQKLSEELELNQIKLIYMPWDHPSIIDKAIKSIKPIAIILMESEIWPGLITIAHKYKIKTAIINAKISDKSLQYYKAFSFVFKNIFDKINLILAQSPADSRKYLSLGSKKENIFMFGNIKFAQQIKAKLPTKSDFGYTEEDIILICGSTHETEEVILVAIFQELKTQFSNLKLILAPRHPERFELVESIIQSAAHLQCIKLTNIKNNSQKIKSSNDILLIDTIGDLSEMYSIGDLAFIGGTLNPKIGGHNVLEPAAYGLPVLIGPHYHKNTHMIELMQNASAIVINESSLELKENFIDLIDNHNLRKIMGKNGRQLNQEHQKILARTAEALQQLLAI